MKNKPRLRVYWRETVDPESPSYCCKLSYTGKFISLKFIYKYWRKLEIREDSFV